MSIGASSLVVASLLALHPFGAATRTGSVAPEPDSGTEPTAEPAPVLPPGVLMITRPVTRRGIGLMVSAGVTGGVAWVTVLGRLAAIDRCKTGARLAVAEGDGVVRAFRECLRSTGSMMGLTILGYGFNAATYALAPTAGAVRGKHDGVRAAWDGRPRRNPPLLIGVGAGLLGAGVVGRLVTIIVFWRQLSPGRLFGEYPLAAHFVLAQVSAASIAGGAGMLSYGLAYRKNRTSEQERRKAAGIAELRVAPVLGWDYTGLSLTGRF